MASTGTWSRFTATIARANVGAAAGIVIIGTVSGVLAANGAAKVVVQTTVFG
jgi:hypothetical protein